jgi:hypothetical protein
VEKDPGHFEEALVNGSMCMLVKYSTLSSLNINPNSVIPLLLPQ